MIEYRNVIFVWYFNKIEFDYKMDSYPDVLPSERYAW
jgi:hypothetical protein